MSTQELIIGGIAVALAIPCLAEAYRRDRKERERRYYFLCQRCKNWMRSYPGIPQECPCGKGREAI